MAQKTFSPISEAQIKKASIATLADRPNSVSRYGDGGLSAQELKERFDAFPALVQKKINEIIEALASGEAAKYITLNEKSNVLQRDNLYDFIALFSEDAGDNETIADYIEAFYTMDGEKTPDSYSIKEILADISARFATINADVSKASSDIAAQRDRIATNEQKTQANVQNIASMQQAITQHDTQISSHEERITGIERYLGGDNFIVDDSTAYEKTVPKNACEKAKVLSIGGMTYKSINLISPQKMLEASSDTTLDGDVFTTNFNSGALFLNRNKTIKYPAGNYSITIQPVSDKFSGVIYIYAADDVRVMDSFQSIERTPTTPYSMTFSAAKEFVLCIGGLYSEDNKYYGTYSYKVQLAHGSNEYAYSPYFEGLRHAKVKAIESKGANYFDKSKVSNATPTATGFSFTNTGVAGAPTPIGKLKDLAPNIKVGDSITFYTECINGSLGNAHGLLHIQGSETSLYGGTFMTITQADLDSTVYAYGDVNKVCEYKNMIFTKYANTPYTPYIGTIDTFTMPEAVQAREGYGEGANAEYCNYIEHTDGKWLDHKKASKTIFDGSDDERWYVSDGYFKTSLADLSTNTETSYGYAVCDKYDETKLVDLPNSSFYCYTSYYGFGVLSIRDDSVTLDVDAWRAHLQSNPLTFVYSLATPEIEDITDLMPNENFIKVLGGCRIVAENEQSDPVPFSIKYLVTYPKGG